ncbi:alpha/beta hydrolase family protein [Acinetobacter stercoris]|uniref:Alpha/beta hydrolase family protein n=1 Tax=Acinetobacter stercoris TaxID=2126983 RepID=A0A2U3N3G4_9GAMM|nr:prolyl oligopeptidase family serine peptidase [Acinetobacter stercoris]SPL72218.1 Alpha/beta hydrolase family protein [Acinetobacter stercoris]
MKKIIQRSILTVSCSTFLFLAACNDDDKEYVSYQNYVSETTYNKDKMNNASSVNVMTYRMPTVSGETRIATAMVMTPKTVQPENGWRVVVWEHGTVGIGDSCAPSNNVFNPRFKNMAESLLAEGYVVIAPDYEGLGTAGIHPYLNLGSAAKSASYAVQAYKARYGHQVNGVWMSVGQSQGGHASLGTAEYENNNPNYKGAVAGAPASSLGYIISVVAPQALQKLVAEGHTDIAIGVYAELLAYAAYTTVGIKAYDPRFNYQSLFQDRSQPLVEFAEGTTGENGLCLDDMHNKFADDIRAFLSENPTKTVVDYPGLKSDFQSNATVSKFLTDNQPATKKINTPVMIIQGTADMAVPYQVTQQLQHDLKEMGTDVTFLLVEGATHTEAIVKKNADLVAFIKTHMPAR